MPVRLERPADHPHVALVTLDRPEKANALDPAMLRELAAAWREIAADRGLRCAVVTGAGERAFCAGMDMKATIAAAQQLARGERVDAESFEGLRNVSVALLAGFDLGVPLVCAVNGAARAAGFDMMLAAEIRFAVPEATFALEEVALGLYPTGNATVLLPRQIGWAHAHELLLTAQPIDAARAAEIGLVNRIVPRVALLDTAFAAADAIARNAPLAVRATRAGVREILALSLEDGWRRQEAIGAPLRKTEDAREAQRAFVEKRKPTFRGV
jgi:enoyl-CoA hydratase/carnithine racemase